MGLFTKTVNFHKKVPLWMFQIFTTLWMFEGMLHTNSGPRSKNISEIKYLNKVNK